MEYLIGVLVAAGVCAFGLMAGFDRERVFYPTVLIATVNYYALFGVMAGSTPAVAMESLVVGVFVVMAVAGFRKSLWWVVAGLVAHGVFDMLHHLLISNPGVPIWWPGFCWSFDVLAGIVLAWLLVKRSGYASSGLQATAPARHN